MKRIEIGKNKRTPKNDKVIINKNSQVSSPKPCKLIERIKSIQKKISDLPLLPQILIISIPFAIILGLTAYFSYRIVFDRPDSSSFDMRLPRGSTTTDKKGITLDDISNPKNKQNPLNGTLMSSKEYEEMTKYPPIASVFGNTPDARPPSGLYKADMAFEVLVEGDITRIVGMFWSQPIDKLGPIRSARKYHIDLIAPYDPLFMHIGYAHSTNNDDTDALKAINSNRIKSVSNTHWRDSTRPAPYNAYSSTENIHELADSYNYSYTKNITPWRFKNDGILGKRGNKSEILISFMGNYTEGKTYDVRWQYDVDSNSYLRFYGANPHSDSETEIQIGAKNLIVQYTTIYTAAGDTSGRKVVTVVGSGEGLLFQDGKQIEITWEQSSNSSRAVYKYKSSGEEVEFNRGMVWVSILGNNQGEVIVK